MKAACVGLALACSAAQQVADSTNEFRRAQELQPVAQSPALAQAAREFAGYMAKTGKYSHTADGRRPMERAAAHGYEHCIVSENIAYLYRSQGYDAASLAHEMVEGWKQSPEHRENMTDPAVTETGVGIARDDKGRWFGVQMFGRPKSAAISFSVRNESGRNIDYRAGERSYSLPPRAQRTHTVCRRLELTIDAAQPFSARPEDGMRYVVTGQGVDRRKSP